MPKPIHYPDQFRGLSRAQAAQARTLLRLLRADVHTWKRESFEPSGKGYLPTDDLIFKAAEEVHTNGHFFLVDNIGCSIDLCMSTSRKFRNPEGRLCNCRFIGTICQEGLNGDPLGLGRNPLNNVWVIPPHYYSEEAFYAHNEQQAQLYVAKAAEEGWEMVCKECGWMGGPHKTERRAHASEPESATDHCPHCESYEGLVYVAEEVATVLATDDIASSDVVRETPNQKGESHE